MHVRMRILILTGLICIAVFCIVFAVHNDKRYRGYMRVARLHESNLNKDTTATMEILNQARAEWLRGRPPDESDVRRQVAGPYTRAIMDRHLLDAAEVTARDSARWALLFGSIGLVLALLSCFLLLASLNPVAAERSLTASVLWDSFVVSYMSLVVLAMIVAAVIGDVVMPYVPDKSEIYAIIVVSILFVLCQPVLLVFARRYAVAKGRAAPWGWLIYLPVLGLFLLKRLSREQRASVGE